MKSLHRTPGRLADADRLAAANIKAIRRASGLTQAALALKLGIDRALVCKIELGHRTVTVGELVIIAETLGVKPEILLQPIRVRASVEPAGESLA